LFIPRTSGTVLPNGSGVGGSTVNQSFVFNGNANRSEAFAMAQRVKAETIAAIREASLRNDPMVAS
jgi:hypothetical protein